MKNTPPNPRHLPHLPTQHSHQPFGCAGLIWYKCVTGVFIEQPRASLSPPFYTMSTFQPRRYWQPCSLTGKAIMSAHWQQIACCANRFLSPLAGARCSSLCSDTIHPFFNALLHSTKTICIKMSASLFIPAQTGPLLPPSDIFKLPSAHLPLLFAHRRWCNLGKHKQVVNIVLFIQILFRLSAHKLFHLIHVCGIIRLHAIFVSIMNNIKVTAHTKKEL